MLCVQGQTRSHLQKEFRLEKENFVHGTSYVGIEHCTISFFFVKPTVNISRLGGWKARGLPKDGFGHYLAMKWKKR